MSEIVVVADPAELARKVALRTASELALAIEERGFGFVALPGGSFARVLFEEFVELSLQWDKVEFFFTDECGVPPEHPASRFAAANLILLKNQRIGAHQLHRVEADHHDLEWAADRYAEELPDEGFDVMLFELGADGHIASLFPSSPAFEESERLLVPVEVEQKPKRRVTMTPAAIALARTTILYAQGRDKAAAVERALLGPLDPRACPAQLLRDGVWLIERGAAPRTSC
ncbi:MAG: 6-phosphogluconolactonase [Planctomycetes bacterium]|nr:6-phosphogluconolactonase [Planctomycetota bacterium]